MDDAHFLSELRRFWDETVQGGPATPGELDPELAATIRRVHAMRDAPPPDPAYARALRERLMHATTAPIPATIGLPLNGRESPPVRRSLVPLLQSPRTRQGWPLAQAAIVLLLVASLLTGFFISMRSGGGSGSAPSMGAFVQTSTTAPDWPMYKGNPARTGEMLGPGPIGQPVELWRFQIEGPASRSPAIANGVAYLQGGDGRLYALDPKTGAEQWHVDVADLGENTPTVFGGTVYVTTLNGALVALDAANGAERWRFAAPVAAESTPVVVDGMLFVGSDEGNVYGIDASSGAERWHTEVGAGIGRSLAVDAGIVFAGTVNGHLHALDAATGEERWQFDGQNEDELVYTPAVANGMVYMSHAGTMYGLDAASGAERWRKTFEGARPASAAQGMIFTGGLDGVVYAIDAATGDDRWTFSTGDRVQAAPVIVGDTVYAASFDRVLYALDAASGTEQWSFDLDGAADYGPSIANGMVYVGTDVGSVYAIGGSGVGQLTAPVAEGATPIATPVAEEPAADLVWRIDGGRGSFTWAFFIDFDPTGNLWVPDGENGRFLIYSPEGELLDVWGEPGDGEGQFNFNRGDNANVGIAFRPDGGFYVADSQNHRIQQFDKDRNFVRAWGSPGTGDGQFYSLIGVTLDADGNVYAFDWGRDDVQKFSPDGEFLGTIGAKGHEDGQFSSIGWGDFDPEGNLWVPDTFNHRIQKFAPDGTFLIAIGGIRGSAPGQFNGPESLTIDRAGRVFVADSQNGRVQVLSPDGQVLAIMNGSEGGGTPFDWPIGIAVDNQGNLYVEDSPDATNRESIQKYRLLPPLE